MICCLYEAYGIPKEETEEFLEFAGFATVGDVMDLIGENRILVKEGLKRLNHTQNVGMASLIRACGLEEKEINPTISGLYWDRASTLAEDWTLRNAL